jgi:glycosyltransferase involved in cell wall biosynthesis
VVRAVQAVAPRVVVVDDGSPDRTAEEALEAGAEVLRQPENRGKGAALQRGIERALELESELILTMDADGQHLPEEVPRFVEAYRRRGHPVLVGNRSGHEPTETATVVGPLCTPLDVLARQVTLPRAEPGDLIVIAQSGAYGFSASPHRFLGHPEPAEVLV